MLSFLILMLVATVLWLYSLQKADASIADLMWGLYFVILSALNYLGTLDADIALTRSLLMFGLTAIWGVRLSVYLAIRNHNQPEDRRYRAMREHHGRHFWWRSWFTVFLLQMLIAWIVGMPQRVVANHPLYLLDAVGCSLWIVGFFFETVGDWQLAQFLKNSHQNQVLDTGLWRYSRHPNYFGDALLWWGFGLIGFAGTGQWLLFLSPLLMTVLLLKISGVSLLEKDISDRRPKYREYIQRTSAFIPWFPKL